MVCAGGTPLLGNAAFGYKNLIRGFTPTAKCCRRYAAMQIFEQYSFRKSRVANPAPNTFWVVGYFAEQQFPNASGPMRLAQRVWH